MSCAPTPGTCEQHRASHLCESRFTAFVSIGRKRTKVIRQAASVLAIPDLLEFPLLAISTGQRCKRACRTDELASCHMPVIAPWILVYVRHASSNYFRASGVTLSKNGAPLMQCKKARYCSSGQYAGLARTSASGRSFTFTVIV